MIATMFEFYRIAGVAKVRPQMQYGLLLGLVLFAANYFFASGYLGPYIFFGFIPLIASIFIIELFRNQAKPIHNIAVTLLGIIYIAAPFSLLNYFAIDYTHFRIGFSNQLLLGFFFLTWANDSGSYAIGMSLGKRRLFPRISPRKTWEGLIGGICITLLTAWCISMFFTNVHIGHWLVIGGIVCVIGIFGDLVESMFKRSLGLKDSGTFLPGHGGLLDRFDSALLSIPIVYVYLEIMMLI